MRHKGSNVYKFNFLKYKTKNNKINQSISIKRKSEKSEYVPLIHFSTQIQELWRPIQWIKHPSSCNQKVFAAEKNVCYTHRLQKEYIICLSVPKIFRIEKLNIKKVRM